MFSWNFFGTPFCIYCQSREKNGARVWHQYTHRENSGDLYWLEDLEIHFAWGVRTKGLQIKSERYRPGAINLCSAQRNLGWCCKSINSNVCGIWAKALIAADIRDPQVRRQKPERSRGTWNCRALFIFFLHWESRTTNWAHFLECPWVRGRLHRIFPDCLLLSCPGLKRTRPTKFVFFLGAPRIL